MHSYIYRQLPPPAHQRQNMVLVVAPSWALPPPIRTKPLQAFPIRPSKPTRFSCSAQPHFPRASPIRLPSRANVPLLLTYSRLLTLPFIIVSELHPALSPTLLSPLLFSISSLTDYFDGALARRWNCTTPLGAFLDPVADKLLVAVALTTTLFRLPSPALVLPTAIILAREIFVSALREWAAQRKIDTAVKVSRIGKFKTAIQMSALVLLLLSRTIDSKFLIPGVALLGFAALLALFSAIDYARGAARAWRNTTEPVSS